MSLSRVVACLALVLAVFGFGEAVVQSWTCDDAYIHFRYSDNLASGKGLVYNAGEYVEGYLTVLWNLALAAAIRVGFDPLWFANAFGLCCFAMTILVLARVALATRGPEGTAIPLAAVLVALHGHAQIFATSGMETSLFTLLVTVMALALIGARTPAQYFTCGLLGVLVTLTRLDGSLFCVGAFPVVVASAWRRRDWRPVALFCLPTLLIYLPYFLIRWNYYGWPLPNLFYAKSAASAYPAQGWFYVWLFFGCYYVMIPAVLALIGLLLRRCRGSGIEAPGFSGVRAPAVLCAFVLPFLAYVVWVGGDFMFGRFLVPLVPLVFLGLQLLLPHTRTRTFALVLAGLCVVAVRARIYPDRLQSKEGIRGITEEPFQYQGHARYMGAVGRALARHTAGTDTRVMIGAGQAALGYFGRFPVVIERNGLTDEYIAHQPLDRRGRVAHERAHLTPDRYFSHERRVNFYFDLDPGPFVVPPGAVGKARWIRFELTGIEDAPEYAAIQGTDLMWIKGYMVTYDRELMDELGRRPGIEFERFPAWLDGYLARVRKGEVDRDRLARDFAEFREFYFDHNQDPERQAAFESALK